MKHIRSDIKKNEKSYRGMIVEVRNNNMDKAISILKKKLQDDGFFNELRKREYYMTKSEKRRLAKAAGKRRVQKENEKRLEEFGF
jgi:small subunit ribosomal protein S21